MIKKCPVCRKSFYFKPCYKKIGRGQTCSVKCGGLNKRGKPVFKRRTGIFIKCQICHKAFYIKKCCYDTRKYCSKQCDNKSRTFLTGYKGANWKGGEYKNDMGYVYIYTSDHPRAKSRHYVKRAVLVMEKHIKRFLTSSEVVHHKNEIKEDDSIKNLKLFPNQSKHIKYHKLISSTKAK